MRASKALMLDFMDGADKRFVIPVYQRKYEWKSDNCYQLIDDLKKIVVEHRSSHFFGSIVSYVEGNGAVTEQHIIDGQQRITTVTLLLLALRNQIAKGQITTKTENLDKQIERFLLSPAGDEGDRLKLRPVKSDRDALSRLFKGDEDEFDNASNLTQNYKTFLDWIGKQEISADELYAAIGKLEIICITLERGDDAQLIFESLNSTGLALTEGDKIRNYVLMKMEPKEQARCFEDYWTPIERCTQNDVSGFARDYLSIKNQFTPALSNVYQEFKKYAAQKQSVEDLLKDMQRYAKFYEKLLACESGLDEQLDDCLCRMKRLGITVTRPFLMEVLSLSKDLNKDGKLSSDEVLQIFLITESYLFRRSICDLPTNCLNKIFVSLNREITRYDDGNGDGYVQKFIYALLSKKESGRFPDDAEFTRELKTRQIYLMRSNLKAYLFERLENYGIVETKNVYALLDNNTYTIEHIMPQHLSPSWTEALGPNADEIHSEWLHRLANLTLTGYNPSLSNKSFQEKRDAPVGGYRDSGLRMNQKIGLKDSWGLPELEERSREMSGRALKIWPYPKTSYAPPRAELDSCTLDDEGADLTGRKLAKYSFMNAEQPVSSWADMFEHVLKFLHQKDKSVLARLASASGDNTLSSYVNTDAAKLTNALQIDEKIFIEKNNSTVNKLSILRRLFALYGADPTDLVFYLKDA